jgi:drug/metabolite transporter (DMT)-like permease
MGSILIVGSGSSAGNDVDEENSVSDYVQGILMVLVIVTISGYSAVFMEKIFKTSIDEKDKAEGVDANEDMEKLIIEKAPVSLADSPATPSRSTNIGSSSIWERNFQLAFYSMLLMLTILVLSSAVSDAAAVGPFSDWSTLATVIVVLQGSGGLIAGATLKYTNANLKTLATTLSIVFSTILEYWLMGLHLNLSMLVGIFTIIVSISSFALNKT